jgi:hypothetical protein
LNIDISSPKSGSFWVGSLEDSSAWDCTFPTPFPSRFPTPFPSRFPTPFPSRFPTPFPSSFPTPSPSLLPTLFPTTEPTPFPYNAASPKSDHDDDSTGAIAGGIVGGVGAIALIYAAAYFVRYYKGKQTVVPDASP